ncbi:hypothetical protein LSAT2_021045 [Lamellibrachia satsuma]|nr:hypothetical protein LSAT2_021045 [Lamellibrachia satsuma]
MEASMCKLFFFGLGLFIAVQAVTATTVHRRQRTDPKQSPRVTAAKCIDEGVLTAEDQDTTRHDTTRHDTTRHDTTRHDTTRHCSGNMTSRAPTTLLVPCTSLSVVIPTSSHNAVVSVFDSSTTFLVQMITGSANLVTEYDWLCPKVLCQQLPTGCQRVEFFVFEHSYEINGKLVEIRCESCQYCIDAPYRRRRSLRDTGFVDAGRLPQMCSRVRCPFVPTDCRHVLPAQMLVHNEPCRRCPACFDNTIGFTNVRRYD